MAIECGVSYVDVLILKECLLKHHMVSEVERNFDFSHPERWPEWRQRFHRYRIATKLDKEEAEVQIYTLLYSMGKEAEQVYQTFTFREGEREDYDNVTRKLDDYFVPKVNVIHERARFHMRVQRPGEMAEEYIRSLHELANTCDFGAAKDENIRDWLMIGILDRKLSEKLQLMPDLTLRNTIELVRQSEQVRGHVNEQAACVSTQISEVAGTRGKSQYSERGRQHLGSKRTQTEQASERRCKRCGRNHGKGEICPAKSAECRKCGKKGHFAAVCRTRVVHEVTKPPEGSNVTHFLGELTHIDDVNGAWMVTLPIQGTDIDFKI